MSPRRNRNYAIAPPHPNRAIPARRRPLGRHTFRPGSDCSPPQSPSSTPIAHWRLLSSPHDSSPFSSPLPALPLLPRPPPPIPVRKTLTAAPLPTPAIQALYERVAELKRLRTQLHVVSQRTAASRAAAPTATSPGCSTVVPECPICMDVLTTCDAVLTRCGHMFCMQCIAQHLQYARFPSCPACRAVVHRAELVPVKAGLPERKDASAGKDAAEGKGVAKGKGKGEDIIDLVCKEEIEVVEVPDDGQVEVEAVLLAVARELKRDKEIKALVQAGERESARVQMEYEKEATRLHSEHEDRMLEVRRLKQSNKQLENSLRHELLEADVTAAELKDKLAEVKQQQSAMDIERKRALVQHRELEEAGAKLEDERLLALREKERYQNLRQSVSAEGLADVEVRTLRKKVAKLRAELAEARAEKEGPQLSWEVGKKREREVDVAPIKTVVQPNASVFGERLQPPSRLNRPKALRRGTGGLGSFAPKKAKVQKPSSGVAGRIGRR